MEDASEHGARSELALRWREFQAVVHEEHGGDPQLSTAVESLRIAINQYFHAMGWVPDELPPYAGPGVEEDGVDENNGDDDGSDPDRTMPVV